MFNICCRSTMHVIHILATDKDVLTAVNVFENVLSVCGNCLGLIKQLFFKKRRELSSLSSCDTATFDNSFVTYEPLYVDTPTINCSIIRNKSFCLDLNDNCVLYKVVYDFGLFFVRTLAPLVPDQTLQHYLLN